MFDRQRSQRVEVKKISSLEIAVSIAQARGSNSPDVKGPQCDCQQNTVRAQTPPRQPRSRAIVKECQEAFTSIGGIWLQHWWRIIPANQPCAPATEILKHFFIALFAHVARPNDPCSIDVRSVVDPVSVYIVIGSIGHDDKMASRNFTELVNDRHTI